MRICDITDGKYNQIFNYTMEASGANGNSTASACLMVKTMNYMQYLAAPVPVYTSTV